MKLAALLLFSSLALFAPNGGDEEAAMKRWRDAAQQKDAALAALEEAYLRIEQAWTAWRTAEEGREPALGRTLGALYEEKVLVFEQRRAEAPKDAATVKAARRAELEELTTCFGALLLSRGVAEPALREAFADLAARDVAGKTAADVPVRLQALATQWLGSSQRFELLWNETLHARASEVRGWRERYDEYVAAGVELDRLQHPETYLPGGAKARAGMVYVAGGAYAVGPNIGIERKKRRITLRPFMLDRCEVTNGDYQTFLESLPPEQRAPHTPRHWPVDSSGKAAPPAELRDHPVTMVTWRDADAYARFAGKRLPTEDEWEVACRGKEALLYPWGAAYEPGRCNDAKAERNSTCPVGDFESGASPFKALQMSGNVEEWTASNDAGDTLTELPSNIIAMVVRGGHFRSPPEYASGLFRWVAPGGSTREPHLGFRCAADLK